MSRARRVEVRPLPPWLDRDRLLGPGWAYDPETATAQAELPSEEAADVMARLRGQGFAGVPVTVGVYPRLKRSAVRAGRTRDARRRRATSPGFTRPDARVDDGSRMGLTPERLALGLGRRAHGRGLSTVADLPCGAGGNLVGFARAGATVVGVERDRDRAAQARHNARVYGVADRVTVHTDDVLDRLDRLQADLAFLDVPWGDRWSRKGCTADDLPLIGTLLPRALARFPHVWAKVPASFDPASVPGSPRPEAWFGHGQGDRQRVKFLLLSWGPDDR